MDIKNLPTPAFLLNLDILENNIKTFQSIADRNNTQLWPMLKTHKSSEIAKLQIEAGAEGMLVGTLDEAFEVVKKSGVKKVMLAYPVLGKKNIERILELNTLTELYIALDGIEGAHEMSCALGEGKINFLAILDSGLGRFGIDEENITNFVQAVSQFKNLIFKGIGTHTGQVYGVGSAKELPRIIEEEITRTEKAIQNLKAAGFDCEMVATGTTPTFSEAVKSAAINVSRPGNYVFFDAIQVALGVVEEKDCSLTVMATISSNPKEDLFIIDCGSKCLGLDKGAHGSNLIEGFGIIKNHPELTIVGLSEEVGKVKINSPSDLKVGDRIEIIPNHSCSCANMTSYLIGHREGEIEKILEVDIRGNSKRPEIV